MVIRTDSHLGLESDSHLRFGGRGETGSVGEMETDQFCWSPIPGC